MFKSTNLFNSIIKPELQNEMLYLQKVTVHTTPRGIQMWHWKQLFQHIQFVGLLFEVVLLVVGRVSFELDDEVVDDVVDFTAELGVANLHFVPVLQDVDHLQADVLALAFAQDFEQMFEVSDELSGHIVDKLVH